MPSFPKSTKPQKYAKGGAIKGLAAGLAAGMAMSRMFNKGASATPASSATPVDGGGLSSSDIDALAKQGAPLGAPAPTVPMTDAMSEREPGWESATAAAPAKSAPAPIVKAKPRNSPATPVAAEPPVFERVEPVGPSWERAAPKTLVDRIPGSSVPYVPPAPAAKLESTPKGRKMVENLIRGRPAMLGVGAVPAMKCGGKVK